MIKRKKTRKKMQYAEKVKAGDVMSRELCSGWCY